MASRDTEALTSGVLVGLFIASVITPAYFHVGNLTLSLSRVFLVLIFFPLLFRLLSGKAGKVMITDYFFMLYAFWILVTLLYHHGISRFALSGITIVEHFGAYLLGRTLILNSRDYRYFIKIYFISMVILFPFAVIELNTNINLWSKFWGMAFEVPMKPKSAYGRMGLERVQSGFEHPIHFGMYCAIGIGNMFYIFRNHLARTLPMIAFATFMSFMSLSSGPLLSIALQVILILWGVMTKEKWKLFAILCAICYVVIDSLSNRTPVTILISTLTFNTGSAWTRIAIWDYGIAAVWRNPIMGIGLNDWPRPFWLTSSVDNFWLLTMMRHGIVGLVFLALGILTGLRTILKTKGLSDDLKRYRTGYIVSLLALMFALSTVHIWGAMGSFVMFYFGAGLWICNAGQAEVEEETEQPRDPRRASQFRGAAAFSNPVAVAKVQGRQSLPATRFPQVHKRNEFDK